MHVPALTPGEAFSVCVTVTIRIPLLPQFLAANTATGPFVVERDRYADGRGTGVPTDRGSQHRVVVPGPVPSVLPCSRSASPRDVDRRAVLRPCLRAD